MAYDKRKSRLKRIIERQTGIVRLRDDALDEFAQKRAREIKRELDPLNPAQAPSHRGYIPGTGTDPNWDSYWDQLPDFVTTFGENLHWNYLHSDTVLTCAKSWKNSPLHWANETNTKFKRIGIGIAKRVLEGDEDEPLKWRWYYALILTN